MAKATDLTEMEVLRSTIIKKYTNKWIRWTEGITIVITGSGVHTKIDIILIPNDTKI